MADRDLWVHAIDLVPAHVQQASKYIRSRKLDGKVSVSCGDFHDLRGHQSCNFDGVYTMETLVHADDPEMVLWNFKRLLKPGRVLVLHEADYRTDTPEFRHIRRLAHCPNVPREGGYRTLLEKVSFAQIDVEDLTDGVLPLWRVFGLLGVVPYAIFRFLGMQHRLVNTMAGVEAYLHWDQGRYISIRAVKPPLSDL